MIDPRARSGVHAARAGTARVTPLACALFACLLPASAAFGAVFTVGPGGSHATVQAALNTAVQTAGDDEVRIAVGTYPEALAALVLADERLDVSGGWNATFDARTEDPTLTVIDASTQDVHCGRRRTPVSSRFRISRLPVARPTMQQGQALARAVSARCRSAIAWSATPSL